MPTERSGAAESPAVRRMKQRLSGLETEAGRLGGLEMKTRPSDVFVVTTPKAGTTWMQLVVHALRTKGTTWTFEEISEAVPFVEMAADVGVHLEAEQVAAPRCFKTHCWEPHVPKGGRYVWVLRDPVDTALSFHRFFEGWFFQHGEVGVEEFVEQFVLARGVPPDRMTNASLWHHLLSWWPRRNDSDVLLVFYEDMIQDLPREVRRVSRFLGIGAWDGNLQRLVAEQASFASMSARPTLFDEHVLKARRNAACGLPADAGCGGGKVRKGVAGGGRAALPPGTVAKLDARWSELVAPATGHASYAELRAAVHRERSRAALVRVTVTTVALAAACAVAYRALRQR